MSPTRKSAALFVCLPRRLLLHPPIAHRGSTASARVTPFEFAVLAGVLVEARAELHRQHFARARKAAGKAIERQRQHYQSYTDDCEVCKDKRSRGGQATAEWPTIRYEFDVSRLRDESKHNLYKPMPIKEAIKITGKVVYRNTLRRLRRQPPPAELSFSLSRYVLLYSAALPKNGANHYKLAAALNRLCQQVGDDAAPVQSWTEQAGQLQLQVAGQWLAPPYVCIRMPLPRSATALALLLFLNAVHNDRSYKCWSNFRGLCDRLGISRHWGPGRAWNAIKRALQSINELIARQDGPCPGRSGIDEFRAAWYEMQWIDGKGVRFKAYCEEERIEEDDEEVEEVEEVEEEFEQQDRRGGGRRGDGRATASGAPPPVTGNAGAVGAGRQRTGGSTVRWR
jgi:hypothetical protein